MALNKSMVVVSVVSALLGGGVGAFAANALGHNTVQVQDSNNSGHKSSNQVSISRDGNIYVTGQKKITSDLAGAYKITAVSGDNFILQISVGKMDEEMNNLKFSENMTNKLDKDSKDLGFEESVTVTLDEGDYVYSQGGTVKMEKLN
ncbi:hypothetical protein [Weissella cibaria]|uniref:hypothetical protein n=1 Tax=Weissella cibaria TaxID=137591 RepID=UPI000D52DE2D|nr:hypothetical protein [Weissella cibaria]